MLTEGKSNAGLPADMVVCMNVALMISMHSVQCWLGGGWVQYDTDGDFWDNAKGSLCINKQVYCIISSRQLARSHGADNDGA